jgi:hypothetical protein
MPARNTRRGPNSSDSLPAVGWAIALARYSAETRTAVRPTETWTAAAIGTRAVAIRELLTGLSADPMNRGATNRHENASPVASLCVFSVAAIKWPRRAAR